MIATSTSIIAISGITVGVLIVVVILVSIFSRLLYPELDLSSEKTGNKKLDEAQKTRDSLDLELGIMEELGRSTAPETLNALRRQLDHAEETLAREKKNVADRSRNSKERAVVPSQGAVVIQTTKSLKR